MEIRIISGFLGLPAVDDTNGTILSVDFGDAGRKFEIDLFAVSLHRHYGDIVEHNGLCSKLTKVGHRSQSDNSGISKSRNLSFF